MGAASTMAKDNAVFGIIPRGSICGAIPELNRKSTNIVSSSVLLDGILSPGDVTLVYHPQAVHMWMSLPD